MAGGSPAARGGCRGRFWLQEQLAEGASGLWDDVVAPGIEQFVLEGWAVGAGADNDAGVGVAGADLPDEREGAGLAVEVVIEDVEVCIGGGDGSGIGMDACVGDGFEHKAGVELQQRGVVVEDHGGGGRCPAGGVRVGSLDRGCSRHGNPLKSDGGS